MAGKSPRAVAIEASLAVGLMSMAAVGGAMWISDVQEGWWIPVVSGGVVGGIRLHGGGAGVSEKRGTLLTPMGDEAPPVPLRIHFSDVVHKAAHQLGIDPAGKSLMEIAMMCMQQLGLAP